MNELIKQVATCVACELSETRTNTVFGSGNENADIVFLGEAPGRDEDLAGVPFIGAAGKLLNKFLAAAGLNRDNIYICNVVKCRPPNNRNPEPKEINSCNHFLVSQLAAIKPKVIVTLGKFASQTLLNTSIPIGKLRGKWDSYNGIPVLATWHPAYVLRSPDAATQMHSDLKLVLEKIK